MRQLLTVILLYCTAGTNAQVVNIPDPAFKAALIRANVDSNHDGLIQESEAVAVTTLDVSRTAGIGAVIHDITGIKSFINLQYLNTFNTEFSNQLDSVDISGMKFLRGVNVDQETYTMSYLKAKNCDSLSVLYCSNYSIGTLDISGSKKIQSFVFAGYITRFFAIGCTSLTTIQTGNSFLSSGIADSLEVTGCTSLRTIYLKECGVQFLDLSSCINLSEFIIEASGSNLHYLNIKNGSQTNISFHENGMEVPMLYICADDFEIPAVRAGLSLYGMPYNISSYCTFFPGGTYNTIAGNTKFDANGNGCDAADPAIRNVAVKITDNSGNSMVRYSADAGNYFFYAGKGNFTLTPYFPYPYFTVTPSSVNVTFDTANSLLNTQNFCIRPNGTHNDAEISFLPTGPARPGFDAYYTLVYKNRGTTTLSGTVTVNFDNSKMNFISSSTPVTLQNTGQLSWNYNNLEPFGKRQIDVRVYLLPPPVNNINDTLHYLTAITPSAGDETPFDNSFILPQRVTGSFDPNDKQCLEGSKLDISKIGDYLHYQIRFQNEGTDTAFNIVVADTLSDKLDWNSFEFIGSSHACNPTLKNNKAEFYFSNINLPNKAINEPASNGWVAFKIKPKPSVLIGDSLNNMAAIYFDFNMPVITNRATTVVSNSSTPVPVKVEYFSISSNNNSNVVNWKAACTNGSAKFSIERSEDGIHFSSIGNINATSVRCQLPFNFTDNNPVAGKNYYRLKITDADGISFYTKTLVTGHNKSGLEITAIANNRIYFSNNKQQTIQLTLNAADGKVVYTANKIIARGNNTIDLPFKNIAGGIYLLTVYTGNGETITKRFIK